MSHQSYDSQRKVSTSSLTSPTLQKTGLAAIVAYALLSRRSETYGCPTLFSLGHV